ncbi:MAG: type 4a pilus biogenesis protein PilO [Candidatus Omnitrophica bacterium]|nr:type 4a pilus biogenesis protein PilO [Candidatus Omnitrophota bacterium]
MKTINLRPILGKLKAMPAQQLFICLGIFVAALLALDGALILRLQIGGLVAIDRKTLQIKADIEALTTNHQRMAQFRESLEAARRSMKNFKAMVRKKDDVPSVLNSISTLANEYGVKIDQLVPQKGDGKALVKSTDGNYTSLAIMIRAKAGYHQLGRFISRLEQERVFWYLESMDVIADAADPARHVVKMQMKILVLGE